MSPRHQPGPPDALFTHRLVEHAFAGVFDKVGEPYHRHCGRVVHNYVELAIADRPATDLFAILASDAWHAAMLHDIHEDTMIGPRELLHLGYTKRCVELVVSLSRPRLPKGEPKPYGIWISEIANSGDRELIQIKLADVMDNSDPLRAARLDPPRPDLMARYADARHRLERALSRMGERATA